MPISTLAQTQQVIQNLGSMQTQANTLEQQISTGLLSQSYSGIAPQAAQLVNLSAQQSQQQGYISTINSVNTRLQTMSLATSTIATLVQQFAGQLQTNAYNTSGDSVQSQAQSLLASIGDYLNTQDGEGYVFSGSETAAAPYDPSGLTNPGSLAQPPSTDYYQGNDDVSSAQIDTDLNVPYGVTADNSSFAQIVQVLNWVANSPAFNQNSATDQANVTQAQTLLNNAVTGVQQMTAQIGMQQSELNNTLSAHQQSLTLAQSTVSNIENVNPATAITQLDALQTQLEASYQTVNVLQNLSLANYLK